MALVGFFGGDEANVRLLFLRLRLLRLELLEDDELLEEEDLELRLLLETLLFLLFERLRDLSRLLIGVRFFGRSLGRLLLLLLLTLLRECLLRDRFLEADASRSSDSDTSESGNLLGGFRPKHRKSLLP